MKRNDMGRRKFMAGVAALSAGGALQAVSSDGMIYRTLGTTGEKVSAIGLGGHHIGRTKESTARQIDESLRRLQTDRIDLMQYHENIRMEDPDRFFAPGGALEALIDAKKAGKIRYIGFTGHKDPAVHLRMLDVAAQHKFHFDTCQMPLNVMDAHFRSFTHQVVPRLVKEGIAVLGMKPIGSGEILKSGVVTPIECLHYAMSLPTSTVINGCDSMDRLNQAFEAVRTFKPMSQAEVSKLLAKTTKAAM